MHLTQLLLLLTALFGAVNAVSLGAYGKVTVACCYLFYSRGYLWK